MKIELVKGFKDFEGKDAEKRSEIKKILAGVFESYGFEPVETPMIEYEDFVKGDNTNDEAVSDIFKLKDRGKRNLALRYEFTFQLKRLMKNKKLPYKRYQIGEVFRDEPISANRFRQFTQCDIDIIGSSVKDDAEILAMINDCMKKLKIKPEILVGNRELLNEILEEQGVKKKDCEQVLREVDKLDKLSEKEVLKNLKKYKAEKLIGILKKPETYFKKYKAYKDVEELKKYCGFYGVKIKFLPTLVRGLSYYNKNVFEIKASGKDSIVGGGSYMFEGVQCTGVAFGLDRIANIVKLETGKEKTLVISVGEDKQAIKLAEKLRTKGKVVSVWFGKLGKGLDYANSKKIDKVIFVGSREVKEKKFKVKDMSSGKETYMK